MPWLLALLACAVDPPVPEPVTYVVVRGDTLFVIARQHGVDLGALKAENGLTSDTIEVGQVLRIPAGGATLAAAPAPRRKGLRRSVPAAQLDAAPPPDGRPVLAMPAAKPCLAGPSLDDLAGDDAAMASAGLGEDDVRGAMNAFVPNVQHCLADLGAAPTGTLTLAITVGCDGRVAGIAVDGRDDWPDPVAGCIVDTLAFAPFPAHDLPDGDTFVYPLRMR